MDEQFIVEPSATTDNIGSPIHSAWITYAGVKYYVEGDDAKKVVDLLFHTIEAACRQAK